MLNKMLILLLLFALSAITASDVVAAELLDVKPIFSENSVSVEISADVAMTYTYYKVPGQTRAVVDIAEADPEKVEPLIVVNKGVVSSISVDKAEISGMVVSRIIFNLVAESNISVSSTADRKKLTVTFGASPTAEKADTKPEPAPSNPPAAQAETPASAPSHSEDALADNPLAEQNEPATPPALSSSATRAASAPDSAVIPAAPITARTQKLEPVVPINFATDSPAPLLIQDVTTGATFIEIRANQSLAEFKTFRMAKPERLVIDFSSSRISQKPKSVAINRFGITKVRIGVSPQNIRIVLDADKSGFPPYTVTSSDNRLRINFK